jgi:hypothetical protein
MTEVGNLELIIADGSFGGVTPSQLIVLQASGVSSMLGRIQFPHADFTSTIGTLDANEFALYHPGTFVADFMELYQAWLCGNPAEIEASLQQLLRNYFDYRAVFGDPDFHQPASEWVRLDDLWGVVAALPLKMAIADAWDRPEHSLRALWNYLLERLRANVGYSLMVHANPCRFHVKIDPLSA